MIVVITASARADLERISDYIATDNPSRALSFVQELRGCCENLASMPYAFSVLPRYASLELRRRVHGAYSIFYRVSHQSRIEIIRIAHGARDLETLFDERSPKA